MNKKLPIFISATSSDLASARDLVAKLLISLGYEPTWQDVAATDGGKIADILKERVESCSAVVQLVGLRYGQEPAELIPGFGRVSYTQFEALYAEQLGKKVIYIYLDESFPYDECDPEPDELAERQAFYRRELVASEKLRHEASNSLELENRVLRFRDELQMLRDEIVRSRRRLAALGAVATVLLLIGVFLIVRFANPESEKLGEIAEDTGKIEALTGKIDTTTSLIDETTSKIAKGNEEIKGTTKEIQGATE